MTSEEARERTRLRIKSWAIYLNNLRGDKLGYPSKVNFATNKPEARPIPESIDDAEYLESEVITVWARSVNQRQAGRGKLISEMLLDEVTSGLDISGIAAKHGTDPRNCQRLINEGVRMTQYMLYPPETLNAN